MVLVEGDVEQNEDARRDVLHVQISAYNSIFGQSGREKKAQKI